MSTLKVNAVIDASGGNTATINSMTPTADSLQGFRNRIINGDMRIDQRNAGAAVTSASAYVVDRFQVGRFATDELAWSIQRDSSAPTGFVNSTKVTITTAESTFTTNENTYFNQPIEGTNISDLAWGSASAKTVTLSFWVRSSLTGTFGGCLYNSAADRFYPFSYSISSANTWEQKSVTIAGDTSGTWLTTTGIGIVVQWSLGAGPDRLGTAGAWTASNNQGVTGQVQVSANLNATWYITGVQLEVGSVATPFERRDYGRELMMCQRYCFAVYANDNYTRYGIGECDQSTSTQILIPLPTVMRAVPTINTTGTASNYAIYSAGGITALNAVPFAQTITATPNCVFLGATVASGLTAGRAAQLISNNNTTSYLKFFAEL
jgi:hypothetical protein